MGQVHLEKKIQTHQEPPILQKDMFKSVWGPELSNGKAKEQEKVNKNMDKLNKENFEEHSPLKKSKIIQL